MKKKLVLIGALLIVAHGRLNGVGEKSTNTSGRDEGSRYNVVFEGVLTTQEGHVYRVNEINFNKLIKQIPVFEMPSKDSFEVSESDKNVRVLKKNPAEKLEITKLDLAEISMISVPNPDVIWYYKRNQEGTVCPIECSGNDRRYKISEDPRASKYIEIKVTDKTGEVDNYLVEANKKIYCSQITASGPREKDVQLLAIKTLTITGYHKRDEEKESSNRFYEKKTEEGKQQPSKEKTLARNDNDSIKISSRNKRMRSTKIIRVSQAS